MGVEWRWLQNGVWARDGCLGGTGCYTVVHGTEQRLTTLIDDRFIFYVFRANGETKVIPSVLTGREKKLYILECIECILSKLDTRCEITDEQANRRPTQCIL